MKIDINGKRNIILDFNAPRKFRLTKDGAEIPYIRTGKNSFRLTKDVDGSVELEEVIEKPRYMKPFNLQAPQMAFISSEDVGRLNEAVQQMSLVNPEDVMAINNAAQKIDSVQMYIAEKQQQIEATQNYIDQQQQILNDSALNLQALETNNNQRLDSAETSIYSLASDLDIVKNATIENTYALDSIREQELITQASLETKADKTDVEKIKEELEEYKDDNESFKNALSNYSGGLASDSPVPEGGKDGQILTKITDESGVYGWKDNDKQDKLTQTQMDAVNSGANQSNIAQITTNQTNINIINGKIPSDASSSNQLADKAWVGNQGYITGITSGDVTTALGYTPYDATNPDGFISGITSGDVTTALGYTPYDASNPSGYTSNVGTVTSVNNTSPDGSGNVTITIPDPLPSQTGQSGKYLTTDGTDASWANVDALPSQTGQSGKYLTTDGSSASWATVSTTPSIDNKSITTNASDQLQTIGVINQNDTTTAIKTWTGTKAQYEAIVTKNASTEYFCTDSGELYLGDVKIGSGAGGLEIGDVGIAPFGIDETENKRRYLNGQVISQAQFVSFTDKLKSIVALYSNLATTEVNWQAEVTNSDLGQCGKFVIDDVAGTIRLPKVVNIQGLMDLTHLGETVEAGLPNITGGAVSSQHLSSALISYDSSGYLLGYPSASTSGAQTTLRAGTLSASDVEPIYGNSDTVQPEAVQYPYFIQVAEGVETSVDVSREIELNNPFSLLDYKYSEYELSNASWLLSNGQFNSGATYSAVYNLLLQIYNGTVTKAGVSVKLSTETYADTDFVLNTSDTTFRLPIKVLMAGSKRVAGNGMTLGLTNGTDNMGLATTSAGDLNLRATSTAYGASVSTNDSSNAEKGRYGVTTDPTKSGIETSANGLYLYFYVGETVQDANIIAAAGVLTDMANLKNTVANINTLPDTSSPVSISLNGKTSEANAWEAPIDCFASITSNGQITGDMQQYFYIKGVNASSFIKYQHGTDGTYGGYCGHTMFFRKGDKMYQTGTVSGNLTLIYFPM